MIKHILYAGVSALLLTACGGGGETNATVNKAAASPAPKGGKLVYSINDEKTKSHGDATRPDRGLRCTIATHVIDNTTDGINSFQITKMTAVTSKGSFSGNQQNYTEHSGYNIEAWLKEISIKDTLCDDIEKLIIERVKCQKSGALNYSQRPSSECVKDITFKSSDKIKIDVAEGALDYHYGAKP